MECFNPQLFNDKVVLVTGGRSGIGYDIAKRFLTLGAKVFICSRKEELLAKASKELSSYGELAYQVCDIRESEQIKAMAKMINDQFGRLDILINNAGGQFPSLVEYISDKGWRAVIENNLNGTFFMSREMAQSFFIPQKSGIIVNIVVNMYRGFPGMAHTGAARAGVENLTKSLAQEWANFNIRVNSVAPGTIESSGLDTYPDEIKAVLDQLREDNLMKRHGTVEDVTNAVCFYASPLSSYTSGTTLYVDGMDHLHSNRMALVNLFK